MSNYIALAVLAFSAGVLLTAILLSVLFSRVFASFLEGNLFVNDKNELHIEFFETMEKAVRGRKYVLFKVVEVKNDNE